MKRYSIGRSLPIILSLPCGEQKRQNPPTREEYDRTPRTPLDHRGTSYCPVLGPTGERAVYRPADSVDRSERLVSNSDLVRVCGPSVVYHSEKGTLGLGLRGSTAATTGQHCDLGSGHIWRCSGSSGDGICFDQALPSASGQHGLSSVGCVAKMGAVSSPHSGWVHRRTFLSRLCDRTASVTDGQPNPGCRDPAVYIRSVALPAGLGWHNRCATDGRSAYRCLHL